MKPDLTVTDRWGLRAEWSRFLSEHTARREALASKPSDEPAVPADQASRPRAGARRRTSAHGTRAAAPNDAGR